VVLQFWTSVFGKKNFGFIVSLHGHGGRGLSQSGHFANKEGGVNFSRFCADVFYGRPLNKKATNW